MNLLARIKNPFWTTYLYDFAYCIRWLHNLQLKFHLCILTASLRRRRARFEFLLLALLLLIG